MEQLKKTTLQQQVNSFVTKLNELRLKKIFTDVTLLCEEKSYSANKAVLAANSPYFCKIFKGMPEDATKPITLEKIPCNIMEIILEFMYTGQLEVDTTDISVIGQLLQASQRLELNLAIDFCTDIIILSLTTADFLTFFSYGEVIENDNMKLKLNKFLAQNFLEVYSLSDFQKLPFECVNAVLGHEDLAVEPGDDVLRALVHWVNFDTTDRIPHISGLLAFVDSKDLSDDYVSSLRQSQLFRESTVLKDFVIEFILNRYDGMRSLRGSNSSLCPLPQPLFARNSDESFNGIGDQATSVGSPDHFDTPRVSMKATIQENLALTEAKPKSNRQVNKPRMPERTVADISLLSVGKKKSPTDNGSQKLNGKKTPNATCNDLANVLKKMDVERTSRSSPTSNDTNINSPSDNNLPVNATQSTVSVASQQKAADYNDTMFIFFKGQNSWFIQSFSLVEDKWNESKPISVPLCERSAIVGVGGSIFFIGGRTACWTVTNKVSIYDIATEKWNEAPGIIIPRWASGAAELDGYIYVVGGVGNKNTRLDDVERYSISKQDNWQRVASLSNCIEQPSICSSNGKLYLIGGYGIVRQQWRNKDASSRPSAIGEIYDPIVNQWTAFVNELPVGRAVMERTFCTSSCEERVYTIRSQSTVQGEPMAKPYLYEYAPKENKWNWHNIDDKEVSSVITINGTPGGICILSTEGNVYSFDVKTRDLFKCCTIGVKNVMYATVPKSMKIG